MPIPLNRRIAAAMAALRAWNYDKPVSELWPLERLVAEAGRDPELARTLRRELASALNDKAAPAARQAACKQLWVLGPGEAIPEVIRLLEATDTHLAEAALIAAARTPSAEFDAALRERLPRLRGRVLIAAVNLMGDRGDRGATAVLEKAAAGSDAHVATTAKIALQKLAWAKDSSAVEPGFVSLFDGRTLEGWKVDTPGVWSARNGVLMGRTEGLKYNDFLRTERNFGDFTLRLKMRLLRGYGNSGVQFRSKPVPGSHEVEGYQADAGQSFWGSLYDESRRKKTLAGPGKDFHDAFDGGAWHEYEVSAMAGHIVLKLDGSATADYREPDAAIPRTGFIAVQVHADRRPVEAWFRNIRIREGSPPTPTAPA